MVAVQKKAGKGAKKSPFKKIFIGLFGIILSMSALLFFINTGDHYHERLTAISLPHDDKYKKVVEHEKY